MHIHTLCHDKSGGRRICLPQVTSTQCSCSPPEARPLEPSASDGRAFSKKNSFFFTPVAMGGRWIWLLHVAFAHGPVAVKFFLKEKKEKI